jgi:hypothetical protein
VHWFFSYSHRSDEQCKRTREALLQCMRDRQWVITPDPDSVSASRPSNPAPAASKRKVRTGRQTVFVDTELRIGGLWELALLTQLDSCDAGILFLTPDVNDTGRIEGLGSPLHEHPWIFLESQQLLARAYRGVLDILVPVCVGTDPDHHAVMRDAPLSARNFQHKQLKPGQTDRQELDRLIEELETLAAQVEAGWPDDEEALPADPVLAEFLGRIKDPRPKVNALSDWAYPHRSDASEAEIIARVEAYLQRNGGSLDSAVANMLRLGPSYAEDSQERKLRKDAFLGNVERLVALCCQTMAGQPNPLDGIWAPLGDLRELANGIQNGKQVAVFVFDQVTGELNVTGSEELSIALREALFVAYKCERLTAGYRGKVEDLRHVFLNDSAKSPPPKGGRLVQIEPGEKYSVEAVLNSIARGLKNSKRDSHWVVVADWRGWLMEPEDLCDLQSLRKSGAPNPEVRRVQRILEELRAREPETAHRVVFLSCVPRECWIPSPNGALEYLTVEVPFSWRQEIHEAIGEGMEGM